MRLYLNERRDADLVQLFACLVRPSPQELVREVMDCTIHDLPLPQPLIDPESRQEPRTSFTIRLTPEEETYLSAFPKGQKSNVVRILLRHALWDVCLSFLTSEPLQKVTKQSVPRSVPNQSGTRQRPSKPRLQKEESRTEETNLSPVRETEEKNLPRKHVVEESVQESVKEPSEVSVTEIEPVVETERPSLNQTEGQDEQTLADQSLDLFNNIIGGDE
ncbi:hypothetical protein ACKX2L_06160 [Lachnospiraceae bacterium YH-ros2228]